MEDDQSNLSPDQRSKLALFCEVTAGSRDAPGAVQLLQSCNWDVEQALQLHWASADEEQAASTSASGSLGTPLLARGSNDQLPAGSADQAGSSSQGAAGAQAGVWQQLRPTQSSLLGWIGRGVRRMGGFVFSFVYSFIFGPGGVRLAGGYGADAAFGRSLAGTYGQQLELPGFFEGPFAQAVTAARRDLKLLVIYLHSEHARYTQGFVTEVLANEFVRSMLDESFLLWGGDVARMESHNVSMMIHARQYPCFCVLLPASVDEIRVIGALHGDIQVDAAVALLTSCLGEMETHRAELVARREQHVEDRQLREQQDREYQEALEMDRKRAEEQQALEREQLKAQREQEEQRRQEQEALAKIEAQRQELEGQRKRKAAALEALAGDPEATARVSLRLITGQRVQWRFRPATPLGDVYDWAGCVAHMSEHAGKGLEVPDRFMLKTSFPSKDLTEMDRTIEELQLANTVLLVTPVEEDD